MKAIERKIRSNLCLILVLLVALLFGPADSANGVTYREDFEVGYFNGAELQYHRGWFQTRSSPLTDIGNNNGVDGSYGLTSGNQSFIWIAHPFSWSDLNVDDYVIFQMDFKTETSGTLLDDDRIGWITKDDDSGSSNIFGVQLDPGGGGYNIECYWRNSSNERVNRSIVTISPTANTWYRLEGKFTKKSATSAKIDVKLWALSDLVNPVASGSIADTSAISPEADRPDTKYFTATTVWPVFKNYDNNDSLDGEVDNAYFHIEDGFDDVAEVEVTDDSATEGGGTGEFKLRLQSQPSQNVNITCIPVINGEDIDLGGGAGLSVTKTFTNSNWSTWQSVTVTAYNDDETESGEIAWIDFSISSNDGDFDGHYAGPLPVRIKIDDNDNDDQSAALVAGPYLMYTNEAGKMMILWKLDSSPTCTLEWDEDEDFTLPLTGSDDNISYDNSGTYGYQYRYTISSLSTSTKYYYRLTYSSGGKSYKYTGSFYTAPASSATNVKFLAYGDTRGNGGDPAYGHDPVCSGIMDTLIIDPSYQTFLLHVADWIENGNDDTDWEDNYFNRDFPNARTMVANIPVQGCFGNHEGSGSLFDIYLPYPYFQSNVRYGSFDYGPVHVAVVDTEEAGFPSSTQENWLKADMNDTTRQWKCILLHRPGWSAGGGHSDNTSVQGLINRLESYLATQGKAGTDIVFAGHNHYYAHCKKDTVCHITTGGGGAPLHNPNPTYTTYVVKVKGAFHSCEIYIRDKVLRCRARASTGSKIETFTLLQDGTHYYVKPDGSNGSNGQSWDTAFQTISYAITQAQNGDLIEVAEGTYEESIDFAGKSIVVTSTDPEDSSVVTSTIIDANSDVNNTGRVVTFDDSEGSGSVLTGFTITGGYAPGTGNARDGGGIFCDGSSPSISNCLITGNYAGDDGGGIFCDDGSEATISNCTVYANEAGDRGGGMYCRDSDSTIQDCDVSSNTAYMGGGLYYTVSEPLVKDCTISENSATGIGDDPDGGGIHCDSSNGTIINCIIGDNSTDDDGGGIFCDSGSEPEIINCTISGNEAKDKGGGMYCRNSDSTIKDSDVFSNDAPIGGGLYYTSSDPLIDGCTISENSSTGSGISADGGGIYLLSSDANIIGSSISDNSTNDDGGGIFCDNGSEAVISDCTINGNDAGDKGGGMYCRDSNSIIKASDVNSNDAPMGGGLYYTSSEPLIERCIIMDNETTGGSSADGGGIYLLSSDANIISSVISDNISDDDAGGIYCLTGSDATITNCTLRGNEADDKGGGIYCKDSSDAVITNCILWGNTATTGSQIHTASSSPVVTYSDVQGGWSGPGNIDSDPLFSDAYHLQSSSPCIDAGDPNGDYDGQKDIDGQPRLIGSRVDIGADERPTAHNINQNKWYMTIQGAIDEATTDDEIVVYPGTYYETVDFNGIACTVRSTDPNDWDVVADTIIDANCDANNTGRVVTFDSGEDANSVLTGFTITGGYVSGSNYGGGIYCYNTSPTITNCVIADNTGNPAGAGIFCRNESPTISNCVITGNSSSAAGAGIFCWDASPTISNCLITGNAGTSYGGGMYNYYSSDATLTNCTFSGNSALYGGGMFNYFAASSTAPTVINCIFWADTAVYGPEIYSWTGSPKPSFGYCDIEGSGGSSSWDPNLGTDLGGNIDSDPLFVDPNNDDFHLKDTNSPCIDVGDPNRDYNGQTDIDGDERVIDITGKGDGIVDVDMGSDEYTQ